MSWDFCTETRPVARKNHHCDAAVWLCECIGRGDLSFTELRVIAKAKRENWQIVKGTKYLKVSGKYEGEMSVFKARFDLNQICLDHDLYDA